VQRFHSALIVTAPSIVTPAHKLYIFVFDWGSRESMKAEPAPLYFPRLRFPLFPAFWQDCPHRIFGAKAGQRKVDAAKLFGQE